MLAKGTSNSSCGLAIGGLVWVCWPLGQGSGAAGKWPEMEFVGKLLQDPINFPAGNYFYFQN